MKSIECEKQNQNLNKILKTIIFINQLIINNKNLFEHYFILFSHFSYIHCLVCMSNSKLQFSFTHLLNSKYFIMQFLNIKIEKNSFPFIFLRSAQLKSVFCFLFNLIEIIYLFIFLSRKTVEFVLKKVLLDVGKNLFSETQL